MQNNPKKTILIMLVFVIAFFAVQFLVLPVQAADTSAPVNYKPSVSIPGSNIFDASKERAITVDLLGEYIKAIYQFGVWIAISLAIFMIMVGGFLWMMAGGSPERVSNAKSYITQAITGLVIALLSYAILETVNPRLVNLNFPIPEPPPNLVNGGITKEFTTAESCRFPASNPSECTNLCTQAEEGPPISSRGAPGTPLCITLSDTNGNATDKCCCACKKFDCLEETFECTTGNSAKPCCQPMVCNTKFDKCYALAQAGAGCNRDNECRSGICNFYGGNECTAIGGDPPGTSCSRDLECKSSFCNFKGSNACTPIAGEKSGTGCSRSQECASGVCESGACK